MAEIVLEKEEMNEREKRLMQEKNESEATFGLQRTKFMELLKQKEDEFKCVKGELTNVKEELKTVKEEYKEMAGRIDEVKSESTILQVSKDDQIARITQRHYDDAASFQHILKEAVEQAFQRGSMKHQEERSQWLEMEHELNELKTKLNAERESSTFSNLARSLQKKMHLLRKEEPENLENSMLKAQEDIELLRSVVSPLEDEILNLKKQLTDKSNELTAYIKQGKSPVSDASIDVKKTKELSQSMQSERASRTDLEMYVSVLNIQKDVLANDNNSVRIALNKAEGLLAKEKMLDGMLQEQMDCVTETIDLRTQLAEMDQTWLMSYLTPQQLQLFDEYKRDDSDRAKVVDLLEGFEVNRGHCNNRLQALKDQAISISSSTSASSENLDDPQSPSKLSSSHPPLLLPSPQQPSSLPPPLPQRQSQQQKVSQQQSEQQQINNTHTDQFKPQNTQQQSISQNQLSSQQQLPQQQLPQQQLPQQQLPQQQLPLMADSTTLSDKEWQKIQSEMEAAKEKLSRGCVRCVELEGELSREKEGSRRASAAVVTMGKLLDQERQALSNKEIYIKELETNLQTVMENYDAQISTLHTKLMESEKFMKSFREQFERGKMELFDYLKNLGVDRQSIQKELNRLQIENDSLLEKHARKAHEMQEEFISLPDKVEDIQPMLLKYREELITSRVSVEHLTEKMGGQMTFLKSQVEAEQQERVAMEDTLTQQLSQLQNQLDIQRQVGEKLKGEKAKRVEEEKKRVVVEGEVVEKERQLQSQLFECKQLQSHKSKLEKTVIELRNKIHGLQVDLDNSEDVQRDFVKLSQTLQIQLEKIRAGETEVRWQHEDDVNECPSCRSPLNPANKYHCRHCGHIFCHSCLSKTVASGPCLKPSRVCGVCHTMLVKSATPFFSQDPPSHHHQST